MAEMSFRRRRSKKAAESCEKQQQAVEYQPKILKKQEIPRIVVTLAGEVETKDELENRKEVTLTGSSEESIKNHKVEPAVMKHSVSMIDKNHIDSVLLLEKLDLENSDFYVVGAFGMKNSGKSTLLNLIATGEPHRCKVNRKLSLQAPLFSEFLSGNGVSGFITKNRVILLDSAPVLHNTCCAEFIVSEANDFRQVQALLHLCHELIVVYEPHQIMSLVRMLICAMNMFNVNEYNEPKITLLENRVRPGSPENPMTELAIKVLLKNNVSDSINSIKVPDFDQVSSDHEDPNEIINKLRDEINTRKELKVQKSPTETEKSWWEKFSKMKMNGGLLLVEFENMREKFYQANEL